MRRRLPPARWAELVSAHRASGLSLERFAQQHAINAKSLGWWRTRLRPASPAPTFVEVRVEPVVEPPVLRLELPTARVAMDLPVGLDLAWLRQVVQALS